MFELTMPDLYNKPYLPSQEQYQTLDHHQTLLVNVKILIIILSENVFKIMNYFESFHINKLRVVRNNIIKIWEIFNDCISMGLIFTDFQHLANTRKKYKSTKIT